MPCSGDFATRQPCFPICTIQPGRGGPFPARVRRSGHCLLLRLRKRSDYYYRAAAARVLDRIQVPTLILHALDDPFIRLTEESRGRILSNPTSPTSRPKTAVTAPFSPIPMRLRTTMATGPSARSYAFSLKMRRIFVPYDFPTAPPGLKMEGNGL